MIRSYPGEVMVRKRWKITKRQFYSSSPIIYENLNFWKICRIFFRVDKIGLGWFGVVPEKLWSIYWKNHTFTAKCLCSRIIYDSGPGFFFFGAQRFVIPIFRFIGYLEHTYWYQNVASKMCMYDCVVSSPWGFALCSSSET